MRNAVIGQTGRIVLSDTQLKQKLSAKRTVLYQYMKVKHGWLAWVCGPFHSRTYGVCGFGTSKLWAKGALEQRLANDYRYIGNLMFSDVDEADNVGQVSRRLSESNARARPITQLEAVGSAGM